LAGPVVEFLDSVPAARVPHVPVAKPFRATTIPRRPIPRRNCLPTCRQLDAIARETFHA
jgi:hypothetical protein